MSFALFLHALEEPFTEDDVRGAFGEYLSPHPLGGFFVEYDEMNQSIIDVSYDGARRTEFISVERPCGDERLFEALYHLLNARPSFLLATADPPEYLVANEASEAKARAELGESLEESGGNIRLISTLSELAEGIDGDSAEESDDFAD